MPHCFLTLSPFNKPKLLIELLTVGKQNLSVENIIDYVDADIFVYSDLSYEMYLDFGDSEKIQNVSVYINEINEQCTYHDGTIRFYDNAHKARKIFLDCFGFVVIGLIIYMSDGTEISVESQYIPVMVKKGIYNESVKLMINYIYKNQEILLLNGCYGSKDVAGLKENGIKGLETQIILAEEIAALYENSYGYFKTNSRFKLQKLPLIERFEKVQQIDSETIYYITQHPEQLRKVNASSGIYIANSNYYPQKTLFVQNVYSKDIYENRIITGFLKKMVDSVRHIMGQLETLIGKTPRRNEVQDEYINSSGFIFLETRKIISQDYEKLRSLDRKLTRLMGMYNEIFHIAPEHIEGIPKSSAIFRAVPQYNRIYMRIIQWYKFGIYDLSKEKYILSFVKISQIYESYLLTKLINYFKEHGFTFNTSRFCEYPIREKWMHQNTKCNNTFVFSDESQRITLYYQPVIYDNACSEVNGIELYRNNTISINNDDKKEHSGHYYVPDYVLKCEKDNCVKYVIMDAKFSSLRTVRHYYIPGLVYKYLFSLSPIKSNIYISGLCVIYGQCTSGSMVESIYDRQIPGESIKPFVEILPMIAGMNDDKHIEGIETVLKMI